MYPFPRAQQLFALCLIFLVVEVVSRPDGAPSSACRSMVPMHSNSPQTSDCPFSANLEKEEMWSNGTLQVTLQPTGGDKFKGFLMMAFDSSDTSHLTPIGTFKIDSDVMGQVIDCRDDGTENAVTHKENSRKTKVDVTWIPPKDFNGSVVFVTTFVKSVSTYWVKHPSQVVLVKRSIVESNTAAKEETTTTKKPKVTTTSAPSDKTADDESSPTRDTVPPEIPDSASAISLLAFYSIIIIGVTIAFMA